MTNQIVKTNHIVCGANNVDLDVAGYSVAEVEEALAEVLNLETDAVVIVDGEIVEDKNATILQPGQRVELVRPKQTKKKARTSRS